MEKFHLTNETIFGHLYPQEIALIFLNSLVTFQTGIQKVSTRNFRELPLFFCLSNVIRKD